VLARVRRAGHVGCGAPPRRRDFAVNAGAAAVVHDDWRECAGDPAARTAGARWAHAQRVQVVPHAISLNFFFSNVMVAVSNRGRVVVRCCHG
jgi:hypothetical protein